MKDVRGGIHCTLTDSSSLTIPIGNVNYGMKSDYIFNVTLKSPYDPTKSYAQASFECLPLESSSQDQILKLTTTTMSQQGDSQSKMGTSIISTGISGAPTKNSRCLSYWKCAL